MNEPTLRAERKALEQLRDRGIPSEAVRVILGKTNKDRIDVHVLNFGTEEPDVAELARAIIDKRLAIINGILEQG